jgi:hypothetical protein
MNIMLTMKSILRRTGLGLATGLLAVGLFAGAGGASAAPLVPAPTAAAATSAASYYDPTIVIPRYVASGNPIPIEGYSFDAYDSVTVSLIDPYGNVVSSGRAYIDEDGYFGGRLLVPAVEPGAYTVVAVDSYGSYIPVGIWITDPLDTPSGNSPLVTTATA